MYSCYQQHGTPRKAPTVNDKIAALQNLSDWAARQKSITATYEKSVYAQGHTDAMQDVITHIDSMIELIKDLEG